jgi:hypothetical protein
MTYECHHGFGTTRTNVGPTEQVCTGFDEKRMWKYENCLKNYPTYAHI